MSYSESVLTEDYLNKFNETAIPLGGQNSEVDVESEYTEDMMKSKKLNDAKELPYNPDLKKNSKSQPSYAINSEDTNLENKYQEILRKRKNRGNYNPVNYQQPLPNQDIYKGPEDQSSVYDDYSHAIHQQKASILKDIEKERLDKVRSYSPVGGYSNWKSEYSPRETFDQKIGELDHLSSTVLKATQEHQHLCREVDEMRHQLRRQQADIRLSERLANDNATKIDFVNRELRDAERRRNQTVRQLELVTEELALKRAKLKNLDSQIIKEMNEIRRLENYGIDKEEIENLLAERDELYQIVKKQENVQLEKYELAKQIDSMRDDFLSEKERINQQIQYLEDEVEASMRKIKQLQTENCDLKCKLDHTKHHLNEMEEEASKSAREVADLRGDYQQKIRKKLEEYELDKEKVEKELKKLEEEKSFDQANLKSHIEQIRAELNTTELERQSLKDIVNDLENHLKKAEESNIQLSGEYEEKIKNIVKEKEREMEEFKHQLNSELTLQVEDERIKFGHEKNHIQMQCDEEMDHLLRNIEMKEREICHLQQQLKQTESCFQIKLDENKLQHDNVMRQEKLNWERNANRKTDDELAVVKRDYMQQLNSLKEELNAEKNVALSKENENVELRRKLKDLNQESKRLETDGLIKIGKMKEELKQRYEKKMEGELAKLQTEFSRRQNEKSNRHSQEVGVMDELNKRQQRLLNKIVKTVVHEINEECKKMALLLNVQPRKVNHSKLANDFSKSDNIITQCLANLEACGSETRSLVHELESKIHKQHEQLDSLAAKFDSDLREARFHLEAQKNKDVKVIRDKLSKEYLKEINKLAKSPDAGMINLLKEKEKELTRLLSEQELWKEKAADKIAAKFDKINQKKVADMRKQLLKKDQELRQYKCSQLRRLHYNSLSPSTSRRGRSESVGTTIGGQRIGRGRQKLRNRISPLSSSPAHIIDILQGNLETLRQENTSLRHKLNNASDNHGGAGYKLRKDRENDLQLRLSRSCSRSRE